MFNREKLKRFLADQGISQAGLARELLVSESAIRNILTGIKQPSLAMTVEISKKMECTVDDLIIAE